LWLLYARTHIKHAHAVPAPQANGVNIYATNQFTVTIALGKSRNGQKNIAEPAK
jgi:hypothetical protein